MNDGGKDVDIRCWGFSDHTRKNFFAFLTEAKVSCEYHCQGKYSWYLWIST